MNAADEHGPSSKAVFDPMESTTNPLPPTSAPEESATASPRWLTKIAADGRVIWWPGAEDGDVDVMRRVTPSDRGPVAAAIERVSKGAADTARVSFTSAIDGASHHWVMRGDGHGGVEGILLPTSLPPIELPSSLAARLSPRQREVTAMLVSGLRPAEVAKELAISLDTTRNHIKATFMKLGVHSQPQLRDLVLGSS